jgi:non-ribosomal peptide synthetase-like protein
LLGSPSFEIPRSVLRDSRFDHLKTGDELRRRLAAKNKHNAVTMGLYLLVRWIYLFGITVLAWGAADLYPSFGVSAIALAYVLTLIFSVGYFALVERAATAFRALSPRFCSIYEPYFWWHERYWKVPAAASLLQVFNGTPFKGAIWRLLGVRAGRRLFDDGCTISEKTMVTIGDDVTLNANTIIQCHSQEDDTFKSDYITIGAGCTLGIGVFVLYGAAVGDGAVLAADSFLMKGEEVPPRARWGGNPATEMHRDRHRHTATTTAAPLALAATSAMAPVPARQVMYLRDRVSNGGMTR